MDRLLVHVTTGLYSPLVLPPSQEVGSAQLGCRYTDKGVPEKPTVLAGHLKYTDTMPFK